MKEPEKILLSIMNRLGAETSTELADKLGMNRNTVATWVRRGGMPYENVIELAAKYGWSLDDLIFGDTDTTPVSNNVQTEVGDELWRILEAIERTGPLTLVQIRHATGLPPELVQRLVLQLHRRRMLRATENGWMPVEHSLMRADTDEELAALSKQVMALFQRHILPGAARTSGAIALCEVRVKADMPGEAIMQTIRETLQAQNVADGLPLIVAIGVAPAEEHGIIDSRSGADDG